MRNIILFFLIMLTANNAFATLAVNKETGKIEEVGLSSAGAAVAAQTATGFTDDGTKTYQTTAAHNVGLGTPSPGAKLVVTQQSATQAPVSGSTVQIVGTDGAPLRLTFDTHNNASSSGTALMFRRSRGTSAAPSAISADDVIAAFSGRGYGATGYAAASTGLINIRASQAFTDTNMGTYLSFDTTPDNSGTAAERMRITAAGNVGIGTISTNNKLHVKGSGNSYITIEGGSSNSSAGFYANNSAQATFGAESSTGGAVLTGTSPFAGVMTAQSNNPLQFGTNSTLRMTLTNDGNLGIGTNIPSAALVVRGGTGSDTNTPVFVVRRIGGNGAMMTVETNATSDSFLTVRNQNSVGNVRLNSAGDSYFNGGNLGIGTNVAQDFAKLTVIGGNVGIGTWKPLNALQINANYAGAGTDDLSQLIIAGSTSPNLRLQLGFDTTSSYGFIRSVNAGTAVRPLILQPGGGSTGNIGIGTTVPNSELAINGTMTQQWASKIPVLTSCGGGSPTVKGTDNDFQITVGTAATGCTATFGRTTYADATCTVSNQSMSITSALTYTVSATAVVISQAVGISGNLLNVHCGFKN